MRGYGHGHGKTAKLKCRQTHGERLHGALILGGDYIGNARGGACAALQ